MFYHIIIVWVLCQSPVHSFVVTNDLPRTRQGIPQRNGVVIDGPPGTVHRRKVPEWAYNRHRLCLASNSKSSSSSSMGSLEQEIAELEQQVLASAQAQMDYNQITRALLLDDDNDKAATISTPSSTWQVALTASIVTAAASFWLFSNLYVSLFVLVTIFVVGNADPTHDDSLLGALARVLGRATLASVQTSKPKMQALARAVVTGQDEVRALRQTVQQLETENRTLQQWQARRLWVEEHVSDYTVQELKEQARQQDLPVGGTKLQLLQRLVDANVIQTNE